MTEQAIVYAVCKAEYEDNGPIALFTSPDLAEQHAAHLREMSGDGYEVEPMPVLDHAPTKTVVHARHGVVYRDDGRVGDERVSTFETWEYCVPLEPQVNTNWIPRLGTGVYVSAASPDDAESAFRETVAAMWPPDSPA
jgi:hypothetical protein